MVGGGFVSRALDGRGHQEGQAAGERRVTPGGGVETVGVLCHVCGNVDGYQISQRESKKVRGCML